MTDVGEALTAGDGRQPLGRRKLMAKVDGQG